MSSVTRSYTEADQRNRRERTPGVETYDWVHFGGRLKRMEDGGRSTSNKANKAWGMIGGSRVRLARPGGIHPGRPWHPLARL
jgi:hypothetical protein